MPLRPDSYVCAVVLAAGVSGMVAGAPGVVADELAQAVFSARVNTVRVDVSVRQGGRAVGGLRAADFDVRDDGVPQQVELVGLETSPVDVVLALDVSGSVQGTRLDRLRAAAGRLIQLLETRDTSASVMFTERVVTSGGYLWDRAAAAGALTRAVPGRDTALFDATHAALVMSGAATGRPLVIVFSDGADTASFLSAAQVLDTARRMGTAVYVVTATEPAGGRQPAGAGDEFLNDLVRLTGGRRLEVSSVDRVEQAFAEILRESRERYLLSYTPTGVRSGGWHSLTVRVRGRHAEVRARPGYLASP